MDRVELELVAETTHSGQFADIHLTWTALDKQLWEGLLCSSKGFLFYNGVLKVVLNKETVQHTMQYFKNGL